MGKLIYFAITSLDGYIADRDGNFDWATPDEEMHAFVNDLVRPVGTYLYGRRMYETMSAWEDAAAFADEPAVIRDFADIWKAANKIVYSTTINHASTARTRVARSFDPEEIRAWKTPARTDMTIAGARLAAHAFRAGVVDEMHLFLTPVVVGGGTPSLPDDVRIDLELLDERRFTNGAVHLSYRIPWTAPD